MGKKVLFVSTYFSIFLLIYALFKEQNYLYTSSLIYIDSSSTSFLHSIIIFTFLVFFTTFFAFIFEKSKYGKFVLIGNYAYLFLVQILCLSYGSSTISSSIQRMGKEWGKINSNFYTALAEESMECCGFYDILEASSYRCKFTTPCSQYIQGQIETYRKLRFLLLTCLSIVFQVYHVYSLYEFKSGNNSPQQTHELMSLNDIN